MTVEDPLAQEWARNEKLAAEVRRLTRTLAETLERKVDLEGVIRQAAEVAFSSWEPPKVPPPRKDDRVRQEEVCVAIASDWHWGSITADYNRDVCERRAMDFADKVVRLAQIQRADHPVRRFSLWLLGDMGAGEDVYPGQAYEIDASATDQQFGVARLISDVTLRLLAKDGFDEGEVVCLPGNHSLGSAKKSPYHPNTNLDRMIYMAARERCRTDRIQWRISQAEDSDSGRIIVHRVGNYGCLLTHGHLFQGTGGMAQIPFYSFAVKGLRWRDMMLAGQMPAFQDLACGHWHKTLRYPIGTMTLRVCGTLQTMDPFSRETIAAATVPAQYLMFVEPTDGRVTAEYRIDLG
jgi:hypothetical protein